MKDRDCSNGAKFFGIPRVPKIKEALYDYIEGKKFYFVLEVRDAIALALGVTHDQRLRKYPDTNLPMFDNGSANALAFFSERKFHVKQNGNENNKLYHITDAGLDFLRARVRASIPENNNLFSPRPKDHRSMSEKIWSKAPAADPELLETRVMAVQSAIALLPKGIFLPPPHGSHAVQRMEASVRSKRHSLRARSKRDR